MERNVEIELESQTPAKPQPHLGPPSQSPWTNSRLLRGFPQTAQFFAADPEKSNVIFKRFDKISIRNLLNLEGRIAALEAVQDELDKDDYILHRNNKDIIVTARSWEDFALLGSKPWIESRTEGIPQGIYGE